MKPPAAAGGRSFSARRRPPLLTQGAFFPAALLALVLACVAVAQAQPAASAAPAWPDAPPGARITDDGWFAPSPPVEKPPLPTEVASAFVIPIHDAITPTTTDAIARKVLRARAGGAELIIFDMDTPGGRSDAMQDISQVILNDLGTVRTVAFVNPHAYSAGAIISLSCDEILITPTGVIGDAMPIMVGPNGIAEIPEKERGKIESAMRAQVRVLAEQNGYNTALCEAMVTITDEIWLIRRPDTGELRVVNPDDPPGPISGGPTTRPAAAAEGEWQYVRTIDGPDELVTLTGEEAVRLGLAEATADDLDAVAARYNVTGELTNLPDTWSEDLVEILTSPIVTSILFAVGLLAVYTEIRTPGIGLGAALAVICFATLFGSQYLVGLAQWWEIALFVLGVLLLAVEAFVIPGFGVAGIAGILCCVAAVLAMVVPNAPGELPIPDSDLAWDWFSRSVFWLLVGLVVAVPAAVLLSRVLPQMPLTRRLFLAPAEAYAEAPVTESSPLRHIGIGDVGVVASPCRPVGTVRFGEDLVDASSEGGVIETGRRVRVLKRTGNSVLVEPVEE